MTSPGAKRSLSVSLVVGTLLIPMSAVAAVWLSDSGGETETSSSQPPAPAPVEAVSTAASGDVTGPPTADIEAACGPEGMILVDLEAAGAITDVQQAALDALRPLCEQQGLALPQAPIPDAIVQTVSVPATAPATTVTTVGDDWEDHQREDDDHEDDDHEDDDHDEHEREDDD